VELVRANPFTPSKLLIKLDLPTFERPAKTTSGRLSFGKDSGAWAAATNFALVIFNCYSIATEITEITEITERKKAPWLSLFLCDLCDLCD
jgi:hypothetical protein